MAYRNKRLAGLVREVVSDCIMNRLSDPRISRFTSVTRVEMSHDLLVAKVCVSVMGSAGEATTTMKGLDSARGMIQTRVARQLDIRQCPELRFELDVGLKIAAATLDELNQLRPPDEAAEEDSTPDPRGLGEADPASPETGDDS